MIVVDDGHLLVELAPVCALLVIHLDGRGARAGESDAAGGSRGPGKCALPQFLQHARHMRRQRLVHLLPEERWHDTSLVWPRLL